MDWSDEPATWKQVKYLKDHGVDPDHPLTKSEATELIRQLGQTQSATFLAEPSVPAAGHGLRAADLHLLVQQAGQNTGSVSIQAAVSRRQEFWLDTCREPTQFRIGSSQVRELNMKYGCVFATPSPSQVQDVLAALDSSLPTWDNDHPELFYETLRLNFPELLRKTITG